MRLSRADQNEILFNIIVHEMEFFSAVLCLLLFTKVKLNISGPDETHKTFFSIVFLSPSFALIRDGSGESRVRFR